MLETWLLHLQPFMKSYFYFLIFVEMLTYVLLQWPKQEGGCSGTTQLNNCKHCSADMCFVGLHFCTGISHIMTLFICAAEAILGMSLIPQ
jgi:hypothetical protein